VSLLDRPYDLDAGAIDEFRDRGHTLVRGLFDRELLAPFAEAIERAADAIAPHLPPLAQRDAYGKAFVQLANRWQRDETVRRFVFAPRFAQVAARLLGVDGVRLYHDQALVKEAHGGHTPWHQDHSYWPLDTDDTITMWMPLADIPADVGSMTFASRSCAEGPLSDYLIGEESDAMLGRMIVERGLELHTYGAMQAGDATFHRGWTLHSAPPNPTGRARPVMTVIWFADGAHIGAITPNTWLDHQLWLDARPVGSVADGPLNPLLWPTG
jgi:ectoine hydroxylase-related dioxygenase (phytanoyl-CoA dioxygenase family)